MSFGIDWDGPAPSVEWGSLQESNTQGITIPELLVPFPEDLNLLLSHLINPMRESSNHGIDINFYEQALEVSLNFPWDCKTTSNDNLHISKNTCFAKLKTVL